MAYGDGYFLALTSVAPTRFLRSTHGILWEPVFGGTDDVITSLIRGSDRWVAVGYTGTSILVSTSLDGRSWERTVVHLDPDFAGLSKVAYEAGNYVAVGSHTIGRFWVGTLVARSADGRNWSYVGEPSLPARVEGDLTLVAGNGRFVRLHWVNINEYGIPQVSSDAGATWSAAKNPPAIRTLAYGNGMFLGFAHGNRVLSSVDGIQWQDLGPTPLQDDIRDMMLSSIRFAGGTFLGGSQGKTFASATGTNRVPVTLGPGVEIVDIAYGAGSYCYAGTETLTTGPDGTPTKTRGVIYQSSVPTGLEPRLGRVTTHASGQRYLAAEAPPGGTLELEQSYDLSRRSHRGTSPQVQATPDGAEETPVVVSRE